MFPPERTTPTRDPFGIGNFPARKAAAGTAPVGSTSSLPRRRRKRTAAAISSSETRRTPVSVFLFAGGEARDAAPALLVDEGEELVERATDLEGARPLQVPALEENGVAAALVEGAHGDDRRPVNAPRETGGRRLDVVDAHRVLEDGGD